MDYEKVYKEALERAKSLIPNVDNGGILYNRTDLEYIFPELRETEDKKIKQWLLGQMNKFHSESMNNNCSEESQQILKAIAWIEKQGK